MQINTELDINGASARALRSKLKMSQEEFWISVRSSQPAGSQYESGANIPAAVRSLIFIKYVAGLDFDASTPEGAKSLREIAERQITKEEA